MNTEFETVNGSNEENIQTGVHSNDDDCHNGELDIQFECKKEVHSEGEDEEKCAVKQQMTENYAGVAVKEESCDPKGTTEDESMAVEALRQLGGMFESVPAPHQLPPQPAPEVATQFRQHICSICGESFERKTDLGNHIVCHQVDRPHACRICGNLFRRKADLQNHMVCHQVERPHRCPHCGADFQRPSSLTNHMKIHTYFPGRALLSSSMSSPPVPNYFPPTSSQPNQPIPNKVSVVSVPSYNGWDITYTCEPDSDSIADGNVLAQNQNLEASATSSNHELNYQPMEPKQYSQISGISENISQFDYEGNSGPVISNISSLTTVAQHGSNNQSGCDINNFDNVTQVDYMKKNPNLNFNSEGYGETAVKVESMPYAPAVECSSTKETFTCPPVTEHPKPPVDTSRRPHVCRHCGLGFSREKALESHSRLHQDHWGSPVECDKCEEMFPEDISLHQHQETCPGKLARTSPQQLHTETSETSPCSVNPSSNVAQPAKMGKHACMECEKRFTTKQKLFRHMWIHRKRPYACEVCGISLEDRGALDDHRRTQHPADTPFTCNECGKTFASRQGLWEHGRMHTGKGTPGSSPFLCQRCGKCFASRQGHLIHTRTHTGERPYGCRFCWKAFRDGGTLRKHERIHTGERPHACPLCPRAFNQKVVLREHVRWVHAARNSDGCQLCGYVIGDREALCAHIVKHSDQLAAAAKAAKAKEEPPKTADSQNVSDRVNQIEPPAGLPQEPYGSSNYVFIPSDGLTSESPDSNINNTTVLEIKTEYTCDMCHEVFKFRTELLDHVRIHI